MGKLLLKTAVLTLIFLFMLIAITVIGAGWFTWQKWQQFSDSSQVNFSELKNTITTGWHEPITQTNNYKNFLILGTDSLESRGDAPPLTDSIIIVSLNLNNGQVKMLSLPRDLWIDQYQTKINTLLAYGQDRNPDRPDELSRSTIAELTGLPIHHTIVLKIEQVSSLIDLLGGVEVEIQAGFIDDQFPRPDVDIKTEHDPAKLYQRVEFVKGREVMNGERALQYMRSRHSQNDQGTDDARAIRQQQVISALINQLKTGHVLTDPTKLGHLYRFYLDNFNQFLPVTQLLAVGKQLWPIRSQIASGLKLESQQLSIYPSDPDGLITHPKTNLARYQNQWVYIIRDKTKFQTEIKSKLNP